MEQNNFEKNVQQKLDGLKIHPSEAVWDNVEKKISKKKKDRRMIFILCFLILFLLSGGYWLFNSGNNNRQVQPVSNLIKSDSKPTNNQDSSLNISAISSEGNSKKHDSATITAKKSKTEASQQSVIFHDESVNSRINKKQGKLLKEDAFSSKGKTMNSSDNKSVNSKVAPPERIIRTGNNEENEIVFNNAHHNLSVKKPGISESENQNENADSINNIQNKIFGDSLFNQLKSEKTAKRIIAKSDSSAKKRANNKQKNRWALGVTFSGGASLLGESLFGVDKSNSAYYQSSSVTSGSGAIVNGGTPYYSPSAIQNSFAFIAGAFIEKNISSKTKMSLGISYKYFSLINKVGNRISPVFIPSQYSLSSDNFYSSYSTQNVYRNNFHYLELPVSVKFQLNNGRNIPLYWQAGINISQLISSNAVQFKPEGRLYYNDNSLFNKTQFGLSTGFSATLFSKQRTPVSIGPYFYYSPTRLANKGLYQDKHFSFIGIRAEILLHKK